jgi:hypothetical protein
MDGTIPPIIQVPIIVPTIIRIRIAPMARVMPWTIPSRISVQGCLKMMATAEATAAAKIKGICGGCLKILMVTNRAATRKRTGIRANPSLIFFLLSVTFFLLKVKNFIEKKSKKQPEKLLRLWDSETHSLK